MVTHGRRGNAGRKERIEATNLRPVRGQEPERAATGAAEGAKASLVEREQIPDSVSLGQNHEGCIGEADVELRMTTNEPLGGGDLIGVERFEPIDGARDLGEERTLGLLVDPRGEQVVELGKHEWRQHPGRWRGAQRRGCRGMVTLAAVDRGQKTAGVEDDHRSPKPVSSSSTRSARSD